jgi:hypothetical protein
VDEYAAAVRETFAELAHAIECGSVLEKLKGPVAHVGFSRLT